MRKKLLGSCLFLLFLLISACSNNEDVITKAVEELDYDVLVPSYIPAEFELEEVVFEGDLVLLSYTNADNSAYIEITQRQYASSLNTEKLLEFTETGDDPYEVIPHLSYLMVNNYVGEYKVNDNSDNISFQFIPASAEIDWHPFYWVNSVGIDEEEFQKVIKSLE
ncbi:hypothetical protein [Texcoconibacillus texcoconensis]|uniref:Thioredoxin-related protein n=1 Tax=Texcoconibacillus texcoconensis TaxID=1095777 RepID=A0A840QKQ0_9BACI|nr:hypothetical protein [Texcoconibacillus texcoconensis]MBB5171933.1 thioredoxin-related protein [Texcoconibacillus texcoconensis]